MNSQKTGGCKCGGKCGKAKKDCTCGTKKAANTPATKPSTTPMPPEPKAPITTLPLRVSVNGDETPVVKAGCDCA